MLNLCHLYHFGTKWQRHVSKHGYDKKFALTPLYQYLVNKYIFKLVSKNQDVSRSLVP